MKINYKYSRNNAQFLYDLSCASNIDQLIRRLTGHQIVTNDNNEKEHVDPAFNVDEILINSVEVFNRAEHETVYNDIDELCAPWDGTENKKLSEEDAKRRNAELTKAASLLKAYNDRFVELDKYLSLLPAEVRNIPNEFMSIGVNGFYRTVSISLGLDKYLDEISTDEKAAKIFNTAEEQSQALNNVMNVINFLSKLDKSAKELFNSDVTEVSTDDQHETDESQPEVSTDDQHEADESQPEPSTDDQHETDKGQPEPSTDDQHETDEGQLEASTDDQHETDEGHEDAPTGDQNGADEDHEDAPTGDQNEADEGHKDTPTGDTEEAPTSTRQETPTGDQHETDEDHEDTPNSNTKEAPTGDTKDESTGSQQVANDDQQDALDGVAAVDAQLFPSLDEFLGSND